MSATAYHGVFVAMAFLNTTVVNAAPALSPQMSWDISGSQKVDVTCDGRPDLIMTGHKGKTLYVTVTMGPKVSKTFAFAIDAGRQAGLCALPVHIEVYPLTCKDDEYGTLLGCRAVRECHAFRVVDRQCDSLNFYWNSKAQRLEWYRH